MKRTYDHKIGIISDTHGLIRQRVVKSFKDVDLIVHAGDVEKPEVLESLQTIAKVYPGKNKGGHPFLIYLTNSSESLLVLRMSAI